MERLLSMTRKTQRWRWRRAAVLALATASAVTAATTATTIAALPVSAQESTFPDGTWMGFLSMDASAVFVTPVGDVDTRYVVQGGFDTTSSGGSHTGEWSLFVDTYLTASDGFTTDARAIAVGPLAGSGSTATLELDLVSASSDGVEFTFTAEELPTPGGGDLTVRRASCSSVSGDWTIDFNGQLLVGSFTALPAGSGGADAAEAVNGFIDRGQALLNDIQTGTVDESALQNLFAQADDLTTTHLGASGCDSGSDRSRHSGVATELINSIMFELSSSPESLRTTSLIEFIMGGYRSGFFSGDDGAEELWLDEYEGRVNAALDGDDAAEVQRLAAASEQLGRTEEAQSLWDRYEELEG